MGEEKCGCGAGQEGKECSACGANLILYPYWCPTCEVRVAEKRCPHCGMKTRKVRQG